MNSASHGLCLWLRGSKLYLSTWEPPMVYLAWNILKILSRNIDRKGTPLKILFISDLINLLALAPLKISASLYEGTIYLLLCYLLLLLIHHVLN